MVRKFFCAFAFLSAGASGIFGQTVQENEIMLKNDYWQLKVEPRWGLRVSSMYSSAQDYDFVSMWKPVEEGRDAGTMTGGALRGIMSGSYLSSQPQDPYSVINSSVTEVSATYDNKYMLLDGLKEEKTISLTGPTVVLSIKITNTGTEDRVIYYRLQDWIGTGLNRGLDSIFVVPWEDTNSPFAYFPEKTGFTHRPFINPADKWFALADISADTGIAVTVEKTDVAAIFFWGSSQEPLNRTAEIFFPRQKLAPGGSWEMELSYTTFSPSSPDTLPDRLAELLTTDGISSHLTLSKEKNIRTGLPYSAVMELPYEDTPVLISPVHLIDNALAGGALPDYGKTLKGVQLYGTPGEAVPVVIGISAREQIAEGNVSFTDLTGRRRRRIPSAAVESRYVAGDTLLLVKSWELSRDVPLDEISAINNDIKEAENITSFAMAEGDVAYVYNLLRIPENTVAGNYTGKCRITTDGRITEVDFTVTVRPFKLMPAKHKTYGQFFRYFIKSDAADGDSAGEYAITRAEYLEALKNVADVGYNGLVIYVSNREDLMWVMEQCRNLGMTGGFVLVRSQQLTAEDIASLKSLHGEQNIMGWGIDEPIRYSQIPTGVRRYNSFMSRGLLTPSFTPNVPVGLLMADNLPGIVPIIAMSGNMAYGLDATRRYKEEGRQVYWYRTGQARATAEQRVFRGIYLWKEPVDGILDWGDDAVVPRFSSHQMTGFAGTDAIPRLGRENIRQALIDLDYLHTLETLASRCRDEKMKEEAVQLLNWIKNYFGDDWYLALEPINNPQYIDDIRQNVAGMIEKLVRSGVE